MTAEANNNPQAIEDDDELNTTAPQSKPEVWKMPEPIFRKTSGKLPQGFVKTEFVSEGATPEPQGDPSEDPPDDPPNESVVAYAEPKPQNPALKILLVLLGMGAMIAFIVVFLTVLYFLFWRS
jgi:hypothetical protein